MEEKNNSQGALLVSFILGGVIGAGVAILLAPKSGQETMGKIKDYAGSMKEKVASSVEGAKNVLEEKKSALSAAVEAGKQAYKKEVLEKE
ncbi:MAG: YtxH domain-containing protein [Proteobacteria bacterium]|nr:YtxH domain-containing protein [Pseudomonadota bacterium]